MNPMAPIDWCGILRPTAAREQTPPPGQEAAGDTAIVRKGKRRVAGLKRAADVLRVLPGDGESLHAVLLGYFDLCHLLLAMLEKLARPVEVLRVATLSLSKRNVAELAGLLDAGKVKRLDVLTSDFQRKHDTDIFAELVQQIATDRRQRVAAARSHAKLITLALDDGQRWTLEGSANLRTSRNAENVCITRDVRLWRFYDGWLDRMMVKHAVQQERDAAAG